MSKEEEIKLKCAQALAALDKNYKDGNIVNISELASNSESKSKNKINYRTKRDEYEVGYLTAIDLLLKSKDPNTIIPISFLTHQYVELAVKDMCQKAFNVSIFIATQKPKSFKELKLDSHDVVQIVRDNNEQLLIFTSKECLDDLQNALDRFYKVLRIDSIKSKSCAEALRFPTSLFDYEPQLKHAKGEIDPNSFFEIIPELLKVVLRADMLCTSKYILLLTFQAELIQSRNQ